MMEVINVFTLKPQGLCLYIGHMLIIITNAINTIERILERRFGMKNLGVVDGVLGIIILRTP